MQTEDAHGALRESRAEPTIWTVGGVQCRGGGRGGCLVWRGKNLQKWSRATLCRILEGAGKNLVFVLRAVGRQ